MTVEVLSETRPTTSAPGLVNRSGAAVRVRFPLCVVRPRHPPHLYPWRGPRSRVEGETSGCERRRTGQRSVNTVGSDRFTTRS